MMVADVWCWVVLPRQGVVLSCRRYWPPPVCGATLHTCAACGAASVVLWCRGDDMADIGDASRSRHCACCTRILGVLQGQRSCVTPPACCAAPTGVLAAGCSGWLCCWLGDAGNFGAIASARLHGTEQLLCMPCRGQENLASSGCAHLTYFASIVGWGAVVAAILPGFTSGSWQQVVICCRESCWTVCSCRCLGQRCKMHVARQQAVCWQQT